jgi:nucleotide-binding universal stress UspA family protein
MAVRQSIVVGVDGSEGAAAAVRWAAEEARARRVPMHLVYAYSLPPLVTTGFAPVALPLDDSHLAQEATEVVEAAAALAASIAPGVGVTTETLRGVPAAAALLAKTEAAATVVVGSRGKEGFAAMLLGSVAGHVATHARCPVVIVRGPWATPGLPVVVGVDGSALSMGAVARAFDAACVRRTSLVAVHVLPTRYGFEGIRDDAWHDDAQEARARLSESLAGWRETYPDVVVEERVIPGHPAEALINAVKDPQMLVVGHGGGGAFAGMLLGSVAVSALRHAPYTVEVVRPVRES